ncbi:MAG TPA: hypothetical protein VMF10_07475 [Candidatus Aquilonibacter sp.]|nr:hypothetical protein [Candidatus Aquilonibacter sp.]
MTALPRSRKQPSQRAHMKQEVVEQTRTPGGVRQTITTKGPQLYAI